MLETRIFILLSLHLVLIECSIPHLNVRKLDNKIIAQQRQDTIDMCRIFNAETEKLKYYQGSSKNEGVRKHRRSKRDVTENHRSKRDALKPETPALPNEDALRIEKIVDKMYDEMEEKGETVAYKRPNYSGTKTKLASNKPARRFNFAPAELLGPLPTIPSRGIIDEPITAKTPRFKHGIVPYYIDSKTYDSHLADVITSAFDYIAKATCIRLQRLRERPTDEDSLKNVIWLYITNPAGIRQCVHSNDRTEIQGVQMMVFGYDCMSLGDITHEVMHVLGFSHEHTRPDRDQYITILWDNIKPGYKKYFEIINRTVDDLPYDYASVLHYPSRAFSRNGQVTILTEPGLKIGQREGFSELDVEKIGMLYSGECVKRNREYLLKTCPTVVKADITQKPTVTQAEIEDYFEDRLWPLGVVNFKLRDKLEFSAEEIENIGNVVKHIEKETCVEFRDLTPLDDALEESSSSSENDEIERFVNLTESAVKDGIPDGNTQSNAAIEAPDEDTKVSDNEIKKSDDENANQLRKNTRKKTEDAGTVKKVSKEGTLKHRKSGAKRSRKPASRRHGNVVFELTRSAKPGCACPKPGKPDTNTVVQINGDCFNSVNDLLHLFVHLLGLDHQHNMHDRDTFLHIVWDQLTPDIKAEMKTTLPPAASVGFSYDYQSVMHYPWLQIKNGRSNIMYPIWNDGWAMGHWKGLSSIDVQKLNHLYSKQCEERRQQAEDAMSSQQSDN